MINSKKKGKAGELELAKCLREIFKLDAIRRSQQYCGGTEESADLVGIPGIHIECKRTESLNVYKALEQAEEDSNAAIPVVFHRRNQRSWVVIMYLNDLPEFVKKVWHLIPFKKTVK